jgi:DNA polymerase elongation subunit (family B)
VWVLTTDSNYVTFPDIKTNEELWEHAEKVATKVSSLFASPLKIDYEGAIYSFFFILTKKRYMYRSITKKNGKLVYSDKIGKKGVLLARRDNSKFVRDVYEGVINMIADNVDKNDVIYWILTEINAMFSGSKPRDDFTVTKSVGDIGNLQAHPFTNDKGKIKAKVGDYTVPLLSNDKEERDAQLAKKDATTPQEFYLLCLPAQVQLAERMRRRGQLVPPGSRLEYVISDPEHHTAKQYEKVECAEYYAKHSDIVKLDHFYYIKALANPLDQVLDVAYGKDADWKKEFILSQYKYRWKIRQKCLNSLKSLFQTNIQFDA